MSLLSYYEIKRLLKRGAVSCASLDCVNGASLDIRLGRYLLIEAEPLISTTLSLGARDPLTTESWDLLEEGDYVLTPGKFVLASSIELFDLPATLAAEYKLKSSMARIGLEHLNAGWCDPTWYGSSLTLELKNMTQHHSIQLSYQDKIGQMIFWRCKAVPPNAAYANAGRYNNDLVVTGVKP